MCEGSAGGAPRRLGCRAGCGLVAKLLQVYLERSVLSASVLAALSCTGGLGKYRGAFARASGG